MYLANGEPLDIAGIADIYLKMSNDLVWKIHKVRHVSKFMRNLILVR